MKNDLPLKQSRLHVETELKALADVLQWFEQFSPLLSGEQWWQCQTALAEGFTNAVRHAHSHMPPTTPIEIEVEVFADYLEMRIWDRGQPFDLEAKLQFLCQQPFVPWQQEYGRGLLFMQQLTDELCYTRTAEQLNCLVMRKKIG